MVSAATASLRTILGSRCTNGLPLAFVNASTAYSTSSQREVYSECYSSLYGSTELGTQFPQLSSDQKRVLGTGSTSADGCDIIVTDEDALNAALQMVNGSTHGLLRFFPSEIIEALPGPAIRVVLTNTTGISDADLYGTGNITAACTSNPFVYFYGDAVNFVYNVRSNPFSYQFYLVIGFNYEYLDTETVRLDVCEENSPQLLQSPELCPLEAYQDVRDSHVAEPDGQTRTDKYMFDVQDEYVHILSAMFFLCMWCHLSRDITSCHAIGVMKCV